jgi:hypothetical protein
VRRYVKPNQISVKSSEDLTPDPVISDISVEGLIGDSLLVLFRETKCLLMASAKGKLDSASSKDLRDNLKLLFEIKDREDGYLDDLTDEQLKALAERLKPNL